MKHLGCTNAIEQFYAGRLLPQLSGRIRQTFTRAHANPQRRHRRMLGMCCHASVKRWGRVANRCANIIDRIDHRFRAQATVGKIHTGTRPHWEHQHAAQAEGKR